MDLFAGIVGEADEPWASLPMQCVIDFGMMSTVSADILVATWRHLLVNPAVPWVLFEHGTCVVLPAPDGDLAEQETNLLREFGRVHVGSPSGDFRTTPLQNAEGWVVGGHHPDILNYVEPSEVSDPVGPTIGLIGRSKRHRDGTELTVIHIEDGRGSVESR